MLNSPPKRSFSRSASPRQSVHLHRDPALDSQAYRRGPWKLIVGHHLVPFIFTKVYNITITIFVFTKVYNITITIFIFTKVYNETADSRFGFDGGSWRGVGLQLMTDFLDLVIGEENALFVKWGHSKNVKIYLQVSDVESGGKRGCGRCCQPESGCSAERERERGGSNVRSRPGCEHGGQGFG